MVEQRRDSAPDILSKVEKDFEYEDLYITNQRQSESKKKLNTMVDARVKEERKKIDRDTTSSMDMDMDRPATGDSTTTESKGTDYMFRWRNLWTQEDEPTIIVLENENRGGEEPVTSNAALKLQEQIQGRVSIKSDKQVNKRKSQE
jgi:hypothetical protein